MQPDIATRAVIFALLVGLLFVVYHMGWQHGRWSQRRQDSIRRRIARQDQERWGITTIHAFNPKAKKR
jgi:hypothetical protein